MKLTLFIVLVFVTTVSFSQDYGNKVDALNLCTTMQYNNFNTNIYAENALEKILNVIGASKRFVMQPCNNINNAVAISYKGIRYILYDLDFMNTINNGNNWGNLFILAHEVGHHINGHSLDLVLYTTKTVETKTLVQSRKQELEADEFAGFILAKLGGDITEVNKLINKVSTNKDDSYSSHPNATKRLNAIQIGYKRALDKKPVFYENKTNLNTAEEYFYRAFDKYNKGDKQEAISDFTKAIDLNPIFSSYNNRGVAKCDLKDYQGAIADYSMAIKIKPDFSDSYYNRGNAKDGLNDYEGAIADYSRAIELNPNFSAYNNRGISKRNLQDFIGSIADFTKAIELNPNFSAYNNRGISKRNLQDFIGAIADFTKAIELNHNFSTYNNRGTTKNDLKDFQEAIADLSKSIELNPDFSNAYYNRGISKYNLEDFRGAIADYSKAIDLDPNLSEAYNNRGISKYLINEKNSACLDWSKAGELGFSNAYNLIKKHCN